MTSAGSNGEALLNCSHMDFCHRPSVRPSVRPPVHWRGAVMLTCWRASGGVLGAPFSLLSASCFHRDLLRIKRIFSFGKA